MVEPASLLNQHAGMPKRRIYDAEGHAHFVTFSCYHRRRLLDHPAVRDAMITVLSDRLASHNAVCCGYVVMPDHVHLIVNFDGDNRLTPFMKGMKQASSSRLRRVLCAVAPDYASTFPAGAPFWQAKYYDFNLISEDKAREKLDYLHANPVRAGLVERAVDWQWSSAAHVLQGAPTAVPFGWPF